MFCYAGIVSFYTWILPNLGDQLPVLSVDPCNGPNVLTVLQGLEEFAVPQHERLLVGHEHLEGVHSFLSHKFLHLISHLHTRK